MKLVRGAYLLLAINSITCNSSPHCFHMKKNDLWIKCSTFDYNKRHQGKISKSLSIEVKVIDQYILQTKKKLADLVPKWTVNEVFLLGLLFPIGGAVFESGSILYANANDSIAAHYFDHVDKTNKNGLTKNDFLVNACQEKVEFWIFACMQRDYVMCGCAHIFRINWISNPIYTL